MQWCEVPPRKIKFVAYIRPLRLTAYELSLAQQPRVKQAGSKWIGIRDAVLKHPHP